MSYALELAAEAQADLARLPIHVAAFLERKLKELAQAPTRLSGPSRFPFRRHAQLFSCELRSAGYHYYFHVMFQYSQDEQTLHIEAIASQKI